MMNQFKKILRKCDSQLHMESDLPNLKKCRRNHRQTSGFQDMMRMSSVCQAQTGHFLIRNTKPCNKFHKQFQSSQTPC